MRPRLEHMPAKDGVGELSSSRQSRTSAVATLDRPMIRQAPAPSAQPRPQILVADADPETRTLYAFVLGRTGCEVVEASDGRQALTIALMRPPALVVAEIRLPLLDGCALCEILRRDRETADVPILIVTSDSRPASVERARQTGADSVLLKPATPEAIAAEARRLLAVPREPHSRSAAIDACLTVPRRAPRELAGPASRHRSQTRALERFSSKTPPAPPPKLRCPSCDGELSYQLSHVGGVNSLHREQWDYFSCPGACGTFQYRQRTRRVRRVE
jgi:CheY-like chemotaxis protein